MSWSSAVVVPAFVVACLVAACGGKIEQTGDATSSGGAGSSGGSSGGGTNPGGRPSSSNPSSPQNGDPKTKPSGTSGSNGGTYINGPVGFVVQEAFSFVAGPETSREARGVWITSFANACDKSNATTGSRVLRIDFSDEAGSVPPATYPLEGMTPVDHATAYAQVWGVPVAGCSATGDPGARFESGTVTIEQSSPDLLVGSFKGIMTDDDGNSVAIDGHFDAPKCPKTANSCQPPF